MADTEKAKQIALEKGFSQVGDLNMEALVFMPEVRDMCAADRCQAYGRNWKCPPACGDIEEIAKQVKGYSSGILVQTIGNMEDDFDYETITDTGAKFQDTFKEVAREIKKEFGKENILAMGAGACRICKKCTYPDAPCRFPDDSYSSMEAYGLWVSKVCELSGIPYNNGKLTITYTGCFLFK